MMQNTPFAVAEPLLILCGGLSRRMGRPKALLEYRGQTLIARQVGDALPHRQVWLASSGEQYAGVAGARVLADWLPDRQGALSAILPGLLLAREQGLAGVYVMSCDSLLLPEQLIACLNQADALPAWEQGITLLKHGDQLLPLMGRWATAVEDDLRDAVNSGQKRVQHWLRKQVCHAVEMPTEWAAMSNFNTPEDFARSLEEAARNEWNAVGGQERFNER